MTAKAKGMIVSVAVLCCIALASGLILGLMNKLTYVDPERETLDKFSELSGTGAAFEMIDRNEGKMYYFAKSAEEVPTYAVYAGGSGGYGGEVKMYIFFKEGVITRVRPGENSETFMDKLEDAGFWTSLEGQPLESVKIPSESDFVSGATRSSRAVADAVRTAQEFYKAYLALEQGGAE